MPETPKLAEALTEAINGSDFPDLKAIMASFMQLSGGAKGIAKLLKREYKAAKPGSMIRSMILQMILGGMRSVSNKENAKDSSLITDADIEREIAAIAQSGAKTLAGRS